MQDIKENRCFGISTLLVLGIAAAVSSCSSSYQSEESAIPCPEIVMLRNTAEVTDFTKGTKPAEANMKSLVRIAGYGGTCSYNSDDSLLIELNAKFEAVLGKAATERKIKAQYFLAMPDLYPDKDAKHIYDLEIEFPQDTSIVIYNPAPVSFKVPITTVTGMEYGTEGKQKTPSVYLGMQMNAQQLEYNRSLTKK